MEPAELGRAALSSEAGEMAVVTGAPFGQNSSAGGAAAPGLSKGKLSQLANGGCSEALNHDESATSFLTSSSSPALARLAPTDLEKQSATIKRALERFQESQLAAQADFVALLQSFEPLLTGCPHEKIRSALQATLTEACDGKKHADAKLAEQLVSATFRLNLMCVDMQRKRQQPKHGMPVVEENRGPHQPGSDDADASLMANGDVNASPGGEVMLAAGFQRSVDEAADVSMNVK